MLRRTFLGFTATAALVATAAAPLLAQGRADARGWEIGPIIDGRNYSVGMPLTPQTSAEGWFFEFPGPRESDGHVHYLTRPVGSLEGARGIRLRYRIDARPGTRFHAREGADMPALISLYFQRGGDSWRMRNGHEWYRWYAGPQARTEIHPGTHEIVLRFDEPWYSVNGKPSSEAPRAFGDALAEAHRVGFTFGSNRGLGHGVYATGPARFTVLDFDVF